MWNDVYYGDETTLICPKCFHHASLIRRYHTFPEPDTITEDKFTEGQIADYWAAVEANDFESDWAIEVLEFFCPYCETFFEVGI